MMEETLSTNSILMITISLMSLVTASIITIQWLTHRSLDCLKNWSATYILQSIASCLYLVTVFYSTPGILNEILQLLFVMVNINFWLGAVRFREKIPNQWIAPSIIMIFLLTSLTSRYILNSPFSLEHVSLIAYTIGEFITGVELLKPMKYKIRSAKIVAILLILEASQTIIVVILSSFFQEPLQVKTDSIDITILCIESLIFAVIFAYGFIFMTNALVEKKSTSQKIRILEAENSSPNEANEGSLTDLLMKPNSILEPYTSIFIIKKNKRNSFSRKQFLRTLRSHMRKKDLLAVYEQDKILGIMLDTDADNVKISLERSLKDFLEQNKEIQSQNISMGIATASYPETISILVNKANQAVQVSELDGKAFTVIKLSTPS